LKLPKINSKNILLFSIFILMMSVTSFLVFTSDSCGLRHMQILNEINLYERSLDPEFCEVLVEKIDLFNDDCTPQVEILDCG
jgi:hypothetical protein